MRNLHQLSTRLERLEAKREDSEYPGWAKPDTPGFLMILSRLKDFGSRVSQASDPTWFRPAKFTDDAWVEMNKLGWAMLESGSYGNAWMLAQAEVEKYPRYRYHPGDNRPDGPTGYQFTPRPNETEKP